ncbi:hypothetical protein ACJMK2_032405 [Sinanodonta woodiana]|uniref:BHLH domain-containing protein n=1 Tax=Sinanodonta woodiana TaxID=1069815 RepID=A0ABD3X321_SINWO
MSVYSKGSDKRRIMQEYPVREEEIADDLGRPATSSPKSQLEQDKKIRREIANSNERRRMQSINAGFQSLRTLIPHHEGEKLSKAAILQQTTEYIHKLEQEKTKLLAQNEHLKRLLGELSSQNNMVECELSLYGSSPPTKRKKRDTESSDEGIAADYDDYSIDEVRREMIDLRHQLDRERRHRMLLEDKARHLESRLYPERLQDGLSQGHDQANGQESRQTMYMDSLQEQVKEIHAELDHQLPPSPPPKSETFKYAGVARSSMSRRNLQTIVEAIRHLEGDKLPLNETHYEEVSRVIPNSEESEKESSITTSDVEDVRSESSGRDSPVQYVQDRPTLSSQINQNDFHEKYPIATNLLHGTVHQQQYFYRPGVIVQKL